MDCGPLSDLFLFDDSLSTSFAQDGCLGVRVGLVRIQIDSILTFVDLDVRLNLLLQAIDLLGLVLHLRPTIVEAARNDTPSSYAWRSAFEDRDFVPRNLAHSLNRDSSTLSVRSRGALPLAFVNFDRHSDIPLRFGGRFFESNEVSLHHGFRLRVMVHRLLLLVFASHGRLLNLLGYDTHRLLIGGYFTRFLHKLII